MYKVKCLPILIVACWISYISLFCTHIVMFNVVHSINHQTLFSFFFTIFKTDHHDTVMYLTNVISSLLPLFVSLEQYLKHIKWNTCALPLCFFSIPHPAYVCRENSWRGKEEMVTAYHHCRGDWRRIYWPCV